MDRGTILERTDRDWKTLPIGVRDAFVLTQLDGRLTLAQVATLVGLDLEESLEIAQRLVELDAARPVSRIERPAWTPRRDPRAEEEDGPTSIPRRSKRPAAPPPGPSIRPTPRRTQRSMRPAKAIPPPRVHDAPCELDASTQATILELDAKLPGLDHYARLGVARNADKKAIKRAYFAFAAKYHPDRFFGKKLGPLGAPIDRVFQLVTSAHDTLIDAAARATYDATLPRAPNDAPRKGSKAVHAARTSMAPRKTTKALKAVDARRSMKPAPKGATVKPAPKGASLEPARKPTTDDEKMRRLVANAHAMKANTRVEMFVRAAEEAFAAGDVIGAANNYRLALEHRDDPYLRNKLEDIEVLARQARFDKAMARARSAEAEKKWADAATSYQRAFEARPDPAAAERAAHALLAGGGDLERARELAQRAVDMRGGNADYRITLAQVFCTLDALDRAEKQVEEALAITPKDPRAKELAKLIAKKRAQHR